MDFITSGAAGLSLGVSIIAVFKVWIAARVEHRVKHLEEIYDEHRKHIVDAKEKALEGIGRIAIIEIEHRRTQEDLKELYGKIDKLIDSMSARAVVTSNNELLLKQLLTRMEQKKSD